MSEQWDALSVDEARAAATYLRKRCGAVVAEMVEPHLAEMAEEDEAAVERFGDQAEEAIADAVFAVASLSLGVPAHLLDPAAIVLGAVVPNIEELVSKALTVPDPANPKVEAIVGSLFGLAQVAQGGIIADHERTMAAFEKAALAPGQHGGWFCPMCGTAYPDDYEPDFCPPCDSRLLRLRAPTEEERVAWLRAHGHQP